MTYLVFVNLNTGARDNIAPPDATVTHNAALDLARALRDGRAAISGRAGYELIALTVGPAMLCNVVGANGPLVTFGVAARSRGAANLWGMLTDMSGGYGLRATKDDAPPTPWCAVRVEPGLLADFSAAAWLAAYEIEIATAWIQKRHLE